MDFYVSWSRSDPHYPAYDNECYLLISPAGVTREFTLERLRCVPRRILLDSGAYSPRNCITGDLTQRGVLEWQVRVLGNTDLDRATVLLSHLDQPLRPGLSPSQAYSCIERTVSNAWELITLASAYGVRDRVQLLGVIQGFDATSVQWCARELMRLGFDRFGLGSLAPLYNPTEIASRARAAVEVVGSGIHVFGVTSIRATTALKQIGISSVDSSRPMREAVHRIVVYSRPFRRFAIAGATRYLPNQQLHHPLPCDCPVCRVSPDLIMKVGRKRYTNLRAVHNYWHLKREIRS